MKAGKYLIEWDYSKEKRHTMCLVGEDRASMKILSVACCMPTDHFCKDKGRKISLAKALRTTTLSKSERAEIWEAYRNMKPNKRW